MLGMLEIRANRRDWSDGIALLIRQKTSQGYAYAQNILLEPVEDHALIEPTAVIDFTTAQVLMDDLWQAGLRPSEGTGSAGSLKATQEHLQDMRKLVFKEDDSL